MEGITEETIKAAYSLNLLNEMGALRHAGFGTDIIVRSENNKYSINSLIFASSSPNIRRDIQRRLSHGEHEMRTDDWGITEIGFEKCVDFMYSGEAKITRTNVLHVLKSASILGLKSLVELSLLWLSNNFDSNLIDDARDMCLRLNISAQNVFAPKLSTISTSYEFLNMQCRDLSRFLRGDVFVNNGDKLIMIAKWILHDEKRRLSYFPQLVKTADKDFDPQSQRSLSTQATEVKEEPTTTTRAIPSWINDTSRPYTSSSSQPFNETIRKVVEEMKPPLDYSFHENRCDIESTQGYRSFENDNKRLPDSTLNNPSEIKKKKLIDIAEKRNFIAVSEVAGKSIKGIDLESKLFVTLANSKKQVEEFNAVSYVNNNLYWLRGTSVKKRSDTKYWNKVNSIHRMPSHRAQVTVWKRYICIVDKKRVHMLDSETDTWQNPRLLKDVAGSSFCVCTNQDNLYVIGGKETERRVLRYDFVRRETSAVAPTIKPRVKASAASFEEKIYIMGGWGKEEISRSMEVYDCRIDMWMQLSDMTKPRTNLRACVFGDKIYAVGGDVGGSKSSVEMYDTSYSCRGWMIVKQIQRLREPFSICVANTYRL